SFKENLAAFAANREINELAPEPNNRADVDFSPLVRIAEWADRARSALSDRGDVGAHLLRFLVEASTESVEAFARSASTPHFANLKQAMALEPSQGRSVAVQAEAAQTRADSARRARELCDHLN